MYYKNVVIILLFIKIFSATAQYEYFNPNKVKKVEDLDYRIGLSSGIGNTVGLFGLFFEYKYKKIIPTFGIGYGTHGGKINIGLRYILNYNRKIYFNSSYTYVTGIKKAYQTLEVVSYDSTENRVTKKDQDSIQISYKPIHLINFSIIKYWKLFNNFYAHLEIGYSFKINNRPSHWQILDDVIISDSERYFLNLFVPGNKPYLGFGISYTFK